MSISKMKETIGYNQVVGLVFILTGVIGVWLSQYTTGVGGTTYGMDPSIVPAIVMVLLAASGAWIMVTPTGEHGQESGDEGNHTNYRRLWLTLGTIAAYIMLLDSVGFVLSTAGYLVIQIYILGPRTKASVLLACIFAVVVPLPIYLLFVRGLNLTLPIGVFG